MPRNKQINTKDMTTTETTSRPLKTTAVPPINMAIKRLLPKELEHIPITLLIGVSIK